MSMQFEAAICKISGAVLRFREVLVECQPADFLLYVEQCIFCFRTLKRLEFIIATKNLDQLGCNANTPEFESALYFCKSSVCGG